LVGYGDADEFDVLDHDAMKLIGVSATRLQSIAH
jgi:hypothetical protein